MRVAATILGAVVGLAIGGFGAAGLASLLVDTSGLGALALGFYGFFGGAAGAALGGPAGYRVAQQLSGREVGPGLGVVAAVATVAAIGVSAFIFTTEPSGWYVWLVPLAAGVSALIAVGLDRG